MIPKIGTPRRNHLLFPDDDTKKQQHASDSLPAQVKVVSGRRSKVLGSLERKLVVKVNNQSKGLFNTSRVGNSAENLKRGLHKQVLEEKIGSPSKASKDNRISVGEKYRHSIAEKGKAPIKDVQLNYKNNPGGKIDSVQIVISATNKTYRIQPSLKIDSKRPVISATNKAYGIQPSGNAEIGKRVLALMERSTSSFNHEEFIKEKNSKSIQAYSKSIEEKTMTMGKVEWAVKAILTALKKLEEGGTLEDTKAVCEPEILNQIIRWKDFGFWEKLRKIEGYPNVTG